MQTAGYSQTPLAKKLGLKEGFKVRIIDPPDYYFSLFSDLPVTLQFLSSKKEKKDFIHYFVKEAKALREHIVSLKNEIETNGMIWISWYKKAAKIPTDITEDLVRELALANGLVDVKVCAVDEVWSGLKLVIPVKLRNNRK